MAKENSMLRDDDLQYYRKRVADEQAKATRESNPEVRKVHEEMAHLFRVRISKITSRLA